MRQFNVTGMSCAACQARVEKAVNGVKGVESCAVSLLTNSMGVEGSASSEDIIKAVEKAGYGASEKGVKDKQEASSAADALKDTETPRLKRRLILSAAFLLALMYISMGHSMWNFPLPAYFEHNHLALTLTQMILALIVMIINQKFFTSGFKSLIHLSPNMDTLVALGSGVSFAWSVYVFYVMCGKITLGAANMELMEIYHNQLYFESAAMIPALITVGKMLEAMSKGKTTNALKSLMSLSPKTATLIRDGREITVPADDVKVGDIFSLRPGQSVPVDGEVIEGEGALDESALTGESAFVDKKPGDRVSAATINKDGHLICKALRVGEDTTLNQIIKTVSDAAATKAPIARIADKVSGVFVPAVIGLAFIVTIGWLLASKPLSFALARGISVLVISCPCALGLATPVAIMVGSGIGAKHGILFKTGESLENLGRAKIIALDKTGTITKGQPEVSEIIPASDISAEELLKYAAALEQASEHPLAKAIMSACDNRGIKPSEINGFKALSGNGLEGTSEGHKLIGGSLKYISGKVNVSESFKRECDRLSSQGKTPLLFARDNELIGAIAVSDEIKPDSAEAIKALKNLGLRVIMLTGDNEKTARAIAQKAGVDEVVSGVLPDGKESIIKALASNGKTIMVGDGINDAPALTRADTGMAIGAGTDVAIDSADIVLVNSNLSDVAAAIRLSRKTLKNIHENLFWAFFYNIICIPLAAGLFGLEMSPMIGAAAMSLSSFTVCMNALRLNLFKPENANGDRPIKGAISQELLADYVSNANDTSITLSVEGMMCPHCEATVKKALEVLPFVREAQASHETGEVKLTLSDKFDEEAAKQAIEQKGYEYKAASRSEE